MLRVRLIHWDASGAARYSISLQGAGHSVEYNPEFSPRLLREFRASPPDVFVIDLSRLPSHGREIAVALRQSKATRGVPLVFCEGEEEKVAQIRALLPDAVFCKFGKLKGSVRAAVRMLPKAPLVPAAMMERYTGRSTAQKLGIRAGSAVWLVDSPREMPAALGKLPAGVRFVEREANEPAVILFFVSDADQMRERLCELRGLAGQSKLWVCWKKGKSAQGGIAETMVRETGIALGLVDYKVCSVSEIWSGLLFAAKR